MKQRLILVGNKPFECDRSAEIDAMDFVVRVNRMNNFGLSGTRLDGYFLGLYMWACKLKPIEISLPGSQMFP